MLKLALITVSYGNNFVTDMFVTSAIGAASLSYVELTLYIVNNSDSPEHIKEIDDIARNISNVTVMHTRKNLGYFGGINYALRCLSDTISSYDFTIVCNNDVLLTPAFFVELDRSQPLVKRASILCPQIISSDGRYENPHVLSPQSHLREMLYSLYYSSFFAASTLKRIQGLIGERSRRIGLSSNKKFLKPIPIYQGYGAMFILARRFFDCNFELEYPGFLMFEEFFVSEQLAKIGELPLFVPSIKVFHLGKVSTGTSLSRKIFEFAKSSFRHYRVLVPLFGKKPSLAYQAAFKLKKGSV